MSDLQLDRTDTLVLTATTAGLVVTYRLDGPVEDRPTVPLSEAVETGRIGPVKLGERDRARIEHWQRETGRPDVVALIATVLRRG